MNHIRLLSVGIPEGYNPQGFGQQNGLWQVGYILPPEFLLQFAVTMECFQPNPSTSSQDSVPSGDSTPYYTPDHQALVLAMQSNTVRSNLVLLKLPLQLWVLTRTT